MVKEVLSSSTESVQVEPVLAQESSADDLLHQSLLVFLRCSLLEGFFPERQGLTSVAILEVDVCQVLHAETD